MIVALCKLVVGMVVHDFWSILLPLHVQDGRTPLYIASWKGHGQILELLLGREADVNHQTKVKPLMLVCVHVCVCSFTRSDFFNVKNTCITMTSTSYYQQLSVYTFL